MKNLILIFAVVLFTGVAVMSNPVQKETEKGKILSVTLVLEGDINLFTHESEVVPATIPENPFDSYTQTFTSYFISKGESDEIIELTCSNYKNELKTMMSDNSQLAEKIGTKGYKFDDLSKIVTTYNQ